MRISTFAGVAGLALAAAAPALAQNETVQANVSASTPAAPTTRTTSPTTGEEQDRAVSLPAAPEPAVPAPVTTDTVVTTTTTPDLSLPPMEPINPYANNYGNELEPIMVQEDEGFDDWGLLGLLGLLGLFGLRRRPERVVYVERAETIRTVGEPPLR